MINHYLDYIQESIPYTKSDLKNHNAIGCIIWNEDNSRVLMQDHIKFNFWTIPVGKVDLGDTIDNTVKKEMKEELNINVKRFKVIYDWTSNYNRNGKLVKVHAYLCEILEYNGTIKNNEPQKHRELKWMTIDEIKNLKKISDTTKYFLKLRDK